MDPEKFEACFYSRIHSLEIDTSNEIIAIDGKTLRGSGDARKNQKALHLVSAWAVNNRMMLGQVKLKKKLINGALLANTKFLDGVTDIY